MRLTSTLYFNAGKESTLTKVADLPTNELVGVYVRLRDERAKRKAAWVAEDEADKSKQERIEGILLKRFQDDGTESVRTAFGTAYKAVDLQVSVGDWDTLWEYIMANNAGEMVQRRISKEAVQQYRAANDNALPPGVNAHQEWKINIRRSA